MSERKSKVTTNLAVFPEAVVDTEERLIRFGLIRFGRSDTLTSGQYDRMQQLLQQANLLARTIGTHCPSSREKALAMTKLEEAVMWANAAIMHREDKDTSKEQEQGDAPDEKEQA